MSQECMNSLLLLLTLIVEKLFKILCKICNKIMNHFTAFDNFSTSVMKKHLESDFCTATE